MTDLINGSHKVSLYVPDSYKNKTFFKNISINVDVIVIEKFNRAVKIEYIVLGNRFEDIIYLPVSKSVEYIINNFNGKINKNINEWLFQNNPTFVENEYKNYIQNLQISIENLKKEKIRTHREQKLKRINGRI